jgi:hypothetical protein
MTLRRDYPIISVFVENVYNLIKEDNLGEEEVVADTTLNVVGYRRISEKTREKSLDFAHDLIKYFTSNLLLHHHQDEVPVFTIFLGVNEHQAVINTHGGYYWNFIQSIPQLQNLLDDLLITIREDLNIQRDNIEEIVIELEDSPRVDIKSHLEHNDLDIHENEDDLFWSYRRVRRTPYSELYALYLNKEIAGEIHIHISKDITATIITILEISDKEKAELMGFIHETLLESLEEEYDKASNLTFYSDADQYI